MGPRSGLRSHKKISLAMRGTEQEPARFLFSLLQAWCPDTGNYRVLGCVLGTFRRGGASNQRHGFHFDIERRVSRARQRILGGVLHIFRSRASGNDAAGRNGELLQLIIGGLLVRRDQNVGTALEQDAGDCSRRAGALDGLLRGEDAERRCLDDGHGLRVERSVEVVE